jgi:hypothetical protein
MIGNRPLVSLPAIDAVNFGGPEPAQTASVNAAPRNSGGSAGHEWSTALKVALYAFILSRTLIIFAAAMSFAYAGHQAVPGHPTETIHLFSPEFFARIKELVLQDDATWYLQVAENGYETRPFDVSKAANWAFFPLHPLTWGVLVRLGISPWLSGVLLANVLFLAALVQIFRWVRVLADEATATRTVLCVALCPTAYFFSMPFSEPLFMFLLASSLVSMQTKRWGWAALFAGLCSGTRVMGILLAPLLWWQARHERSLPQRTGLLLGASTGLALFMLTLWIKTGDPLAFVHIQPAWARHGGNLADPFLHWYSDPLLIAEPWNAMWINLFSLSLGLIAAAWLWRRGFGALCIFVVVYLLLPWSSGSLMGMARYVSTCIPVFFAVGVWLREPRWFLPWLIASACLLAGMAGCFTMSESFAGV